MFKIALAVFAVAFVLVSQALSDTTIIIQKTRPRILVPAYAPMMTYQVAPVVSAPAPVVTAPVPDPVPVLPAPAPMATYQTAPVVTYQRSYVSSYSVRAGGGCPLCPGLGLATERRHARQSARHAAKAARHAELAAYHADRS